MAVAAERRAETTAAASTCERTIRCTVPAASVAACCSYGTYHVSRHSPKSRTSATTPTTIIHGLSARTWRSRLPSASWPGHRRSARRRLTMATGWLPAVSAALNVRPRRTGIPAASTHSGVTCRWLTMMLPSPAATRWSSASIEAPKLPRSSGFHVVRPACSTPGIARAASCSCRTIWTRGPASA